MIYIQKPSPRAPQRLTNPTRNKCQLPGLLTTAPVHFFFFFLHTRVLLLDRVRLGVRGPGGAGRVECVVVDQAVLDLGVALEDLQREALAGVPADVAVHQPRARVVRLEREDQVARAVQHGRVSPGRVVEGEGDVVAVGAGAGGEDEEVVAVEMDGVGHRVVRLDDEEVPLVGGVELDDAGRVGEGEVVVVDLEEGRVLPLDFHGRLVHVPAEEVVGVVGDSDGLGERGAGGGGLGDVRNLWKYWLALLVMLGGDAGLVEQCRRLRGHQVVVSGSGLVAR